MGLRLRTPAGGSVTINASSTLGTDETLDIVEIDESVKKLEGNSSAGFNSGYVEVSKKMDNFEFLEDANATYKVVDKNRYVKIGDKVIDTYGEELVTNGDSSDGTSGWILEDGWSVQDNSVTHDGTRQYTKARVNENNLMPGKTYRLKFEITKESGSLYLALGFPIEAFSTGKFDIIRTAIGTQFTFQSNYAACTIDNISVREIQTADFTNTAPNVTVVTTNAGVTGSKGDYLIDDYTVPKPARTLKQATRDTADMFDYSPALWDVLPLKIGSVYYITDGSGFNNVNSGEYVLRVSGTESDAWQISPTNIGGSADWLNLGTASAMSLDNPYFRDREDYGVTHQALAYHAWNTVTKSYEGIETEILMNDMSVFATPKVVMEANEFTEVGSFLYQKGDYLCIPVVRTQMRNKGAYHPVYNPKGCASWQTVIAQGGDGGAAPWFSSTETLPQDTLGDAFTNMSIGQVQGNGSIVEGEIYFGRPDNKYYDVIYANDTIDMREFAKKATQFDIDLLRQDKIDNSVRNEVSIVGIKNNSIWSEYLGGKFRLNFSNKELSDKGFANFNPWTSGTSGGRYVSNPIANQITGYVQTSSNIYYITEIKVEESNADRVYIEANSGATLSELNSGYDIVLYKTNNIITSYNTELFCDPANYPSMITNRLSVGLGVNGIYPALLSETGASLIPDGTNPTGTKLNSKATNIYNRIYSPDGGISCLSYSSGANYINNTVYVDNTIGTMNFHFYETSNDPYEVTDSLPVIDVEPKVVASNSHSIYKDAMITAQIAGKIPTGNGSRGLESKTLDNAELDENRAIQTTPEHNAVVLDKEVSPTAKWFNVLEEDDYGLHAGIYGQELVVTGGNYGDSDEFEQLLNGTLVDLNGNTVRTLHGSFPLNIKVK